MLETPHAVVGAAIATQVGHPALAIPLAFASHFILDKLPHWNPHLRTELKTDSKVSSKSTCIIAADTLIALSLITFIGYKFLPFNQTMAATIFLSGLAAMAPDAIEFPYFFMGIKSKFIERWLAFQSSIQFDVKPIPGILIQIATVLFALKISLS